MKIVYFGFLLVLASVHPSWSQIEVPNSFNYQGVLRDGIGGALTGKTPTVSFSLYDVSSGSSPLWTGSQKVLLDSNGLFNVTLHDDMSGAIGGGVTLAGVIASNRDLFMGIKVDENTEISPRQQLLSVPFALRAGDVNQASSGFTVYGGALTANSGAKIVGELQATKIQMGTNTLSVADGAASLKLTGDLDITDQLHVMQNAQVDGSTSLKGNVTVDGVTTLKGSTTVSNLAVKGVVSLFPTNITFPSVETDTWTTLSSSATQVVAAVSSDGFVVINFWINFDLSSGSEENYVLLDIQFKRGGTVARAIQYGSHEYDINGNYLTRTDVVTLPVSKGESVAIHPRDFSLQGNTAVKMKVTFVPFGTGH